MLEMRLALQYKILKAINEYEQNEIVKISKELKQMVLTDAFIKVMNIINNGEDR